LEKCVACHYYDRNIAKVEEKGVRWGQCRRNVPVVHPVTAKAYMVEGIWPHVRDDDWCGEWVAIKRKSDMALPDPRNLMLQPSAPTPIRTAGLPPGSLMAPVAPSTDATTPAANSRFGSD
jgi:hypothetical protein